ncbi:MAG: hypothetical protein K2M46_02690 [Lachnospiraceae bacterium]|nr:hypothetical protein [Lachnospiraceae bacterium]
MKETSILTQGYCLCTIQENLCFTKTKKGAVGDGYYTEWLPETPVMRRRENPFCMDVTFLLAYILLSKEQFFQWQEGIDRIAKQEWGKLYYQSEYHNATYEAFFDMRSGADLDWLTGMMIKVRQGGFKEYWKLLNGIVWIFPEEHKFMEQHPYLRLEEIIARACKEKEEILQAGKLLILLILAEFYQVHISKKDWWNEVDRLVIQGILYYQGQGRWKNTYRTARQCRQIMEESLRSHGIHPLRLKKYKIRTEELPVYAKIQREDWNYLWKTVFAMEECMRENGKMYKRLKERGDRQDSV